MDRWALWCRIRPKHQQVKLCSLPAGIDTGLLLRYIGPVQPENMLIAVGNPILDSFSTLPAEERGKLIRDFSLPSSGALHVDKSLLEQISAAAAPEPPIPGGGAFNTVRIYAQLGGQAAFRGAVGNDGNPFHRELSRCGADDLLCDLPEEASGRSLTLLTEGGEQTPLALVCPGAAVKQPPLSEGEHILRNDLRRRPGRQNALMYLEGFLLPQHELLHTLLQKADAGNMPLALDLAAAALCRQYTSVIFRELLPRCRFLFGTEEEVEALGIAPEAIIRRFPLQAVIVKRGSAGSTIYSAERSIDCAPHPADIMDESGCGDLYAGVLLNILHRGAPLEEAGRIASFTAARAAETQGGRLKEKTVAKVEALIHTIEGKI